MDPEYLWEKYCGWVVRPVVFCITFGFTEGDEMQYSKSRLLERKEAEPVLALHCKGCEDPQIRKDCLSCVKRD
jgi:hypothetical protein